MDSKRPRLDRTATYVVEVGIVLTGLSAVLLGLGLTGGRGVQGALYAVQAILWYALLLCVLSEMLCLAWAISLMAASRRRRPPTADIMKAIIKTICFPVALYALNMLRVIGVGQFDFAFRWGVAFNTKVFLFGRYYRLSAAQALGVATLFFGLVAMCWLGWVVVPLIRKIVRPEMKTKKLGKKSEVRSR